MLRRIINKALFSQFIDAQKDIHIRRDSYKAIHITPQQIVENTPFQNYVSDLLKENNQN